MKTKLVECVPNFSEGRDSQKIKMITDAIARVSQVQLLGVEPGFDTNRTVVTFVGPPEAVEEAAFQAIKTAGEVIEMSAHSGAHPRMGATDVCPFVPVQGVTMQECAEIAKRVGARAGSELGLTVYLYEEAASAAHRKNLADVRRGEYEGLSKKLKDPAWAPDFGPTLFDSKRGATIMGAREFLIAYNINLNSTDKQHATELAFDLREKGRVARKGNIKPFYFRGVKQVYLENNFPCGDCDFVAKTYAEVSAHTKLTHQYDLNELLKANDVEPGKIGQNVYKSGKFKQCKAIGWYVSDYGRAQISINLTHYKVTPPHLVLEAARAMASERGLVVTGSEIVGLIPLDAMIGAGKFYLKRQGKSVGAPTGDVLKAAVTSLGLNDVAPFDIEKKVLGYQSVDAKALINMTVSSFADEVSRDTPAPGGGSIAALAGSLGAALASMVANLAQGKEGSESKDAALDQIAAKAQALKNQLMTGVDEDTQAFNAFMDAMRLPKNTPEEKSLRAAKMQEGLKVAIEVPWQTALSGFEVMKIAREAAVLGNPNTITDAGVGIQMGFSAVRGALWNVRVNLKDITDKSYFDTMAKKCEELLATAQSLLTEAGSFIDLRLGEMIAKKQKGPTG